MLNLKPEEMKHLTNDQLEQANKIEDLITKSPWTVRNFIDDCLIADRHNEKEGEI